MNKIERQFFTNLEKTTTPDEFLGQKFIDEWMIGDWKLIDQQKDFFLVKNSFNDIYSCLYKWENNKLKILHFKKITKTDVSTSSITIKDETLGRLKEIKNKFQFKNMNEICKYATYLFDKIEVDDERI